MERVGDDVDVFLGHARMAGDLARLDEVIREVFPEEDRVLWRGRMWGGTEQAIVGYTTVVQSRPRGDDVEWFLVGLAEQKNHLSVYVNAVEDGVYLVQARAASLGRVKVGAAAVTFRSVSDIDLDEFRALLVRARELNDRANKNLK